MNNSIEQSLNHLKEGSSTSGQFSGALNEVYDELMSQDLSDTQKIDYVQNLTKEVHARGMFPELVNSYVSENFGDLDLDDSGWISKQELDKIQNSQMIKSSMTPFEEQIVRYMASNIGDISNGANDETGFENNGISLKDVDGYQTKQQAFRQKSKMAQGMLEQFGTASKFSNIDSNSNGYISKSELSNANSLDSGDKDIVEFMKSNRKEIFKTSNDQKFFETEITLKDIQDFAKANQLPELSSSVKDAKEFNFSVKETGKEADSNKSSSVKLDEQLLKDLDLNDNGYISKGELAKSLDSKKWMATMNSAEQMALKGIQNDFSYIQRASNDEIGYENNGISIEDLKTQARNHVENRKAIPSKPGDHFVKINDQGAERSFLMHIPKSYDGTKPMPMVVMLHGILQNSEEIAKKTGLSELAEKNDFIAIYPDSQGWVGDNIRTWSIGQKHSVRNVDDGRFVDTIIDTVQDKLNIDNKKVYMAGYSNGAMLAHEVACRFPERLTAVAAVQGTMNGCEVAPETPVPIMMLNAMGDGVIPHKGRSIIEGVWPLDMESASYSRNFWVKNNGADKVKASEPTPGLMKRHFKGDTNRSDVVSYMIKGGTHVWPGANQKPWLGMKSDLRFNASEMVWNFFNSYSR